MRTKLILACCLYFLEVGAVFSQNLYGTTAGEVSFYSDTPLETIEAVNKKTGALINLSTRELAVQMRITDFVFPNKLMQEHFNENYLESEKYPTAVFKGKIKEDVDLSKPGTFLVTAEGILTIHGVNRPVLVKGTIQSTANELELDFKFQVKPEDHKVKVPNLVITKIAEVIDVSGKMILIKK